MKIRLANSNDYLCLKMLDHHIDKDELAISIALKRIYIVYEEENFVGWLRYNLFWDEIPFINMLYIMDDFRGKGYGSKLMNHFEQEMKKYKRIMVSTQENESAKYFYEKLGYKNIGGFLLPNETYELIMYKEMGDE